MQGVPCPLSEKNTVAIAQDKIGFHNRCFILVTPVTTTPASNSTVVTTVPTTSLLPNNAPTPPCKFRLGDLAKR